MMASTDWGTRIERLENLFITTNIENVETITI